MRILSSGLISFYLLTFGSLAANAGSDMWYNHVSLAGRVMLFTGPSLQAHQPFSNVIDHATKSVTMEMYHLIDPIVVSSLVNARSRGLSVSAILDGKSLSAAEEKNAELGLEQGGVSVFKSSPKFSITHTKSLVVDSKYAIVSSMNLTDHPEVRRDYGLVLEDPGVISEMESVFAADMKNSQDRTGITPQVNDPRLLWSPVNSNQKLHEFILSATTRIDAVAENVLDEGIVADLIAMAKKGLMVRVLSPACPLGQRPDGNYNAAKSLVLGGAHAKQMLDPATPDTPYLHGKMMVVDGKAYLGSINYSYNSMNKARELGIVMDNATVVQGLADAFDADFGHAVDIPNTVYHCTSTF